MTLVHRQLDRCRNDHNVMCATVGVGFYGGLALAALAGSALSAVWH